jgi:hypothetical protein
MTRFTIENGPITVKYGRDHATGVFFSVGDNRLIANSLSSSEMKRILDKYPHEEGIYLKLHTGSCGFGKKVSNDTMKFFLGSYGVSEDQIDSLFPEDRKKPKNLSDFLHTFQNSKEPEIKKDANNNPANTVKDCVSCAEENASLHCSKCKIANYCNKECQTKDWGIHKLICGPMPPKLLLRNSVYGILLSEFSAKPQIVEVPYKTLHEDYEQGYDFDVFISESFFGKKMIGRNVWPYNPLKGDRAFENVLEFNYNDDFLNDDSLENQCIKKITKNKNPHPWRGPMLVLKIRGNNWVPYQRYMDMSVKDMNDVVDFLLWYGSYKF